MTLTVVPADVSQYATIVLEVERMASPRTGGTHYYVQLRFLDRGRTIKVLVVCNNLDLCALGPIMNVCSILLLSVPRGINP